MKLSEIVAQIITTSFDDSVDVDIETIATEFGFNLYYCESPRLSSYSIGPWLCTDTYVGTTIIFLDKTPVALAYQPARKSETEYHWFGEEAYTNTQKYIAELVIKDANKTPNMTTLDIEMGEGYPINYSSQILKHLTSEVIYAGERCKIVHANTNYSGGDTNVITICSDGKNITVPMKDIIVPWR